MMFNFSNIFRNLSRNVYNNRSSVNTYKVITEEDLEKLIVEKIYILDVRTKNEYEKMRFKNAINIPVCDINWNISTLIPNKNDKILVYCLNGERTREAIIRLNRLGYNNIYIWKGAGLINLKEGKFIEY